MVWYDTGYTCAVQHTTIHSLTHHPVPTLPATYLPVPAKLAVRTVHSIINGDDVPCKVIPVFSFLPQGRAAAGLEPADYPSLRGALVHSFSFPNTSRSLFVFMPCLSACQLASSTSNLQGFSVVAGGTQSIGYGRGSHRNEAYWARIMYNVYSKCQSSLEVLGWKVHKEVLLLISCSV